MPELSSEARRAGLAATRHAVREAGERARAAGARRQRPERRRHRQQRLELARGGAHAVGRLAYPVCGRQHVGVGRGGVAPHLRPPTLAQDRARGGGTRAAARREQDACEPGVHGQPVHRRAVRGQAAVLAGLEPLQQRDRGRKRLGRGRLEPVERPRVAAPRQHVEDGRRQVHALDLRLAPRAQDDRARPTAAAPGPVRCARRDRRAARPSPPRCAPARADRGRARGRSAAPCAAPSRSRRSRPRP